MSTKDFPDSRFQKVFDALPNLFVIWWNVLLDVVTQAKPLSNMQKSIESTARHNGDWINVFQSGVAGTL